MGLQILGCTFVQCISVRLVQLIAMATQSHRGRKKIIL